ncbi:acyl-CoA dehydrogenase, partial [Candidatus Bathyarchaeota archaeon]
MPLDFEFTEEQKMFREAVREWCSKNLTLEKVREIDNKGRIPREVIKGLADLGLLVMTARED